MEQIVDLGSNAFDNLGQGQCLLSRTTATFIFPNDQTSRTSQIINAAELKDIWVIKKCELTLNLRLETSWRFVSSLPTAVKHLVDTLERILIHINPRLYVSKTSQECHTSPELVTIQITIVLCESLDGPRDSLAGRLPRLVRGWLFIEPSPPPEIAIAILSDVTIHLQSPLVCSPRDLFVTRMCLPYCSPKSQLDNGAIRLKNSKETSRAIPLRPHHVSSAEAFDIGNTLSQEAVCIDTITKADRNGNSNTPSETAHQFETLLGYSIQNLIFRQPHLRLARINESRNEASFSLSEVAPSIFRPGYCDNIRCRAGLLPVVTKAIGVLFQICPPKTSMNEGTPIASQLGVLCGSAGSATAERLRSLIRCTMWKALQAGTYKTTSTQFAANSTTASPVDDMMLMEEWDYEDSQPLSVGSYVSLSERSPRSFLEEEGGNYGQPGDTAVFDFEDSHYDYSFDSQLHHERTSAISWPVSQDMAETSGTIQSSISCGLPPLSEGAASRDYQRAHDEGSMAGDSISLLISSPPSSIVSSSFLDIPSSPISTVQDDNTDIIIADREIRPSEDTARIRNVLAI